MKMDTEVYYEFEYNPIEIHDDKEDISDSAEYEFKVWFTAYEEEPQTWHHPGEPAYVEIDSIEFEGHDITNEIETMFPDLFEKVEMEAYQYMLNYD